MNRDYYMKQTTTSQKLKKNRSLTDSRLAHRLRDRLFPFMLWLSGTKVKFKLENENHPQPIPDKPIIFAANHSAFPDTPLALRSIGRRSYILAGTQRLTLADWFFFMMIGTIWVDRHDKKDMAASKQAIMAHLALGDSVLWFPEGTWNLTPDLLMLPMKWGITDIARQADAQIIPLILDYDRKNMICRVRFGTPLAGAALSDRAEAIRSLRDEMAAIRWDFITRGEVLHRADIDPAELKEQTEQVVAEYPPLDWEYEQTCIFRPYQ